MQQLIDATDEFTDAAHCRGRRQLERSRLWNFRKTKQKNPRQKTIFYYKNSSQEFEKTPSEMLLSIKKIFLKIREHMGKL